jgi:hypothetical protein
MNLNIELFERVKAFMREEPKRADMNEGLLIGAVQMQYITPRLRPTCNTVGCIAGTAAFLSDVSIPSKSTCGVAWFRIVPVAIRELGIDRYTVRDAQNKEGIALFHVDEWPENLEREYLDSEPGSLERVEIICRAIDTFIADPEGF